MPSDSESPIEVTFTPSFKKDLKRLAKKYRHIQSDLQELLDALQHGELPGDRLQGLPYEVYKERVKNSDANKGQSGGYRVVYYVVRDDLRLLLTVYSKSDQPDINPEQILAVIKEFETEESEDESDE